jgi:hypothetical protein
VAHEQAIEHGRVDQIQRDIQIDVAAYFTACDRAAEELAPLVATREDEMIAERLGELGLLLAPRCDARG